LSSEVIMLHSAILLGQIRAEQEQGAAGSFVYIIALGCAALACLFFLVVAIAFAAYGKLWFRAYMSSADVSMLSLIGMGFRQVNSQVIVRAKIMAGQAALDINRPPGISTQRLEAHYLAGGNVMNVMN